MHLLALVDAPDHVCCRYRVRAFAPALEAAGDRLSIEGLARAPLARLRQLRRASGYDAVLLQRKLLPAHELFVLRRAARRLLFDYDDAVLYRDSYDRRGPVSPRRAHRFARTVRAADQILAGNRFLADLARRAGARPDRVLHLPTCVEPALYQPAAGSRSEQQLRLVWIGSSSTLQGLESSRSLWDAVGRAVPGLVLRIIADRSTDLGALPVEFVPWSEATEAQALAEADAGLAWIPDDLWSRGKCGLKLLQYQAAGLPVVANPVGVQPEMVEPGVSGLLAGTSDSHAWIDSLARLRANPDWRLLMGREARRSVETRFSVAAWAPTFVAAFCGHKPVAGPDSVVSSSETRVDPGSRSHPSAAHPSTIPSTPQSNTA